MSARHFFEAFFSEKNVDFGFFGLILASKNAHTHRESIDERGENALSQTLVGRLKVVRSFHFRDSMSFGEKFEIFFQLFVNTPLFCDFFDNLLITERRESKTIKNILGLKSSKNKLIRLKFLLKTLLVSKIYSKASSILSCDEN